MAEVNKGIDSHERAERDQYDRGIIPAETAARMEREGELYKTKPTEEREAAALTDDQTSSNSIRTTDGYTVDNEGLLNNYAVEPEMYYETPGDARDVIEQDKQERLEQLAAVKDHSEGELSMDDDKRDSGTGLV